MRASGRTRMAALRARTLAELLAKAEMAIRGVLGGGGGARQHITAGEAKLLASVLQDLRALAAA